MKSPLTRITLLNCILWSGLGQPTGWAADVIGFNRDIRPILSRYCLPCHGPDAAARKGHLRLDRFDDATRIDDLGRAAIIAGNPAASR
ncbi:MAG: c-type cytochrome domain-containing protein [Limisphaerales bacterium]